MNEVKIVAEEGKQELFIYREFDAPRELVFKAFTDPKLVAKWMGPKDMTIEFDYLVEGSGGKYRFINEDQQGNKYHFQGVVHEETAPERIIRTFEFEGMPERGHVALETALFEELPNGRTKAIMQSVFRSVEDRDGMVMSGMERGVKDGFEKLDELLKKML